MQRTGKRLVIALGGNALGKTLPEQMAAVKLTAKAIADQFPDTSVDVLTTVAQRYKDIDAWNATPIMKQEALERLETVMETAGQLQHSQWVDFSKLVDNSFAEKAK